MIPILYDENEITFESMGISALPDAKSVVVRRALNGQDELTMQYPVDGLNYKELKNSRCILAEPEFKKAAQAYRIYRVTKPMNGLITVNARHISEQKMFLAVKPFRATSAAEAMMKLEANIIGAHPFTFYTDKTTEATYDRTVISSMGAVLGGSAGSFLDVYGGEYEFDMYQVRLLSRRGIDRGVSVMYGKNLTKLEVQDSVDESVVTSVCPIWTGTEDDDYVFLPEYIVDSEYVDYYPFRRVAVVDFSESFEEKPTLTQLRNAANSYINRNKIGIPKMSIKVSFALLAQTEEYKEYSILETLNLGDDVSIYHNDLGVDVRARIVETVYDVIKGRYISITVGQVKSNMSSTLKDIEKTVDRKYKENKNMITEAVTHATEMITGISGGYVIMNTDNAGHPYEILIMDTADKMTATNVLRINQAGIGFSRTGYQGPFTTAWTIDGHFVADFITAGTMSGNRVRTGLIQDVSGQNYWNLDTGEWVNRSLTQRLDNMQAQIDDDIQTFSGADIPTLNNYPANQWTTAAMKDNHVGDLYIVTDGAQEGAYYRFLKTGSTYQWKLLEDTEVSRALAEAEEALRRVEVVETEVSTLSGEITNRVTTTQMQNYVSGAVSTAKGEAIAEAEGYTDNKLSGYSTTVETQNMIQITKEGIEQSVSQTYTTKADFNELAIGGRNLILNTATPDASAARYYPRIIKQAVNTAITTGAKEIAEHGIKVTNTGATRTYIAMGYTTDNTKKTLCGLTPGQEYTLSADVEWKLLSGTQNNTTYYMRACLYDDKTTQGTWTVDKYFNIGAITPALKGAVMTGRCEFTFVLPENITAMYLSFQCSSSTAAHYAEGDYISIANVKLEKGNRATDWTPAPEDIDERITQLDASISILPGQIASKVSYSDYNGNQIASLINQTATTIKLDASKINLSGYVTIASLGAGGTTNIDGSRITTGYISADRIQAGTVTIGKMDSAAQSTLVVSSASKQMFYISDSKTQLHGGSWSDSPAGWRDASDYVWTKTVTTVTKADGTTSTTESTALYDENTTKALADAVAANGAASTAQATADSAVSAASTAQTTADSATKVVGGYTIKWNASTFSNTNNGEAYICALDPITGTQKNINGTVMWNGNLRVIPKGMINPNAMHPYNIPVYVVCRVEDAFATYGNNYLVWYNNGWKYLTKGIDATTEGQEVAAWTWVRETDIVIGKYVEPANEAALVDCEIYNPPLTSNQLTTSGLTASAANSAASAAATAAATAQTTANNAATAAANAATAASAAQSTANNANSVEQLIFISKPAGTASVNTTTTWITDVSGGQNKWTLKRPQYDKSNPVLFIATQRKTVGGTVTCTSPMIDATTTVIDGGNIITGTVTANALAAQTITGDKIAANTVSVAKLTGNIGISGWNIDFTNGTFTIGNISANNITTGTLAVGRIANGSLGISKLTSSLQGTINTASSTATTALSKANGAESEVQTVYISKSAGTTSVSAPTTWITDSSGDQNKWTIKRPEYAENYPALFVATQRKAVDGTLTCTTPLIDATITKINGANIITGTIAAAQIGVGAVTADKIGANAVTANKLAANAVTAAKIAANAITGSKIAGGAIVASKLDSVLQETIEGASTNASTALTNAATAQSTADSALNKANSANSTEQLIYKNAVSGTSTMAAPSSWVTDTTGGNNKWTIKRPAYNASYPVLFVATQRKNVQGTITCTTPMIDATTTVIDGGSIITGSITANKVNVADLSAFQATLGGWTVASNRIEKEITINGVKYKPTIQSPLEPVSVDRGAFYVKVTRGTTEEYPFWVSYGGRVQMSDVHISGGDIELTSSADNTSNLVLKGQNYWMTFFPNSLTVTNISSGDVSVRLAGGAQGSLRLASSSSRSLLNTNGLVFSGTSTTASYMASEEKKTYTASSSTISFGTAAIMVRKWGIGGFLRINLSLSDGSSFPASNELTICTLDADHCPRTDHAVMVPSSKGTTACLVQVKTNGDVTLYRYNGSAAFANGEWIRTEIPMDFVN